MHSAAISMRTFETEKCGDECLTTYEHAWERRFDCSRFNGARFIALSAPNSMVFCRWTTTARCVLLQRYFRHSPGHWWNCFVKYSPRSNYRHALIALIKCGLRIYAPTMRASKRVPMLVIGGEVESEWLCSHAKPAENIYICRRTAGFSSFINYQIVLANFPSSSLRWNGNYRKTEYS